MNEAEKIFVRMGKVIEWPFTKGPQLIALLTTSLADEPAVKTAVVGLIAQIGAVTAEGGIVVAGKGINLTADVAEVAAMQALWTYVVGTFLPAVQKAWGDLQPEIDAIYGLAQPAAPAAATASAPAAEPEAAPALVPAPGLHTVVPR